jgi:hypothetical protein
MRQERRRGAGFRQVDLVREKIKGRFEMREQVDPKTHTAVVAFAECGCVVAVDLDGEPESIDRYIARGLGVRWETEANAIEQIRQSKCHHYTKGKE